MDEIEMVVGRRGPQSVTAVSGGNVNVRISERRRIEAGSTPYGTIAEVSKDYVDRGDAAVTQHSDEEDARVLAEAKAYTDDRMPYLIQSYITENKDLLKGEDGAPFDIYRTYPSIHEMQLDWEDVPEGKFVMISTTVGDENNGKIYKRVQFGFEFIVAMASIEGPQGPQGERGDKGDKGDKGDPGTDATVTAESIASALGYTPADEDDVPTKTSDLTNDAGFLSSVAWGDVTGKPSSFPPSSHTHTVSQITDFPTRVSAFQNDAGYLTQHQSLANYYTKGQVDSALGTKASQDDVDALTAAVATKANASDVYTKAAVNSLLTGKADIGAIPTVPTLISAFTNDRGYITAAQVPEVSSNSIIAALGYTPADEADIPEIPSNVSYFTNDAGYLTSHQSLANYYTKAQVDEALGDKADLTDIPTIPTAVSAFTNDVGYLTQHQSLANYYTKSQTQNQISSAVSSASATLQAAIDLKADASSIPTKVSDLTNDAGYITLAQVPDVSSSSIISALGYTPADAASLTAALIYKGSVASFGDLPASGNKTGDVYNVVAADGDIPAGTNYAWNGSSWDALGGAVDLSVFLQKTGDTMTGQLKSTYGSVPITFENIGETAYRDLQAVRADGNRLGVVRFNSSATENTVTVGASDGNNSAPSGISVKRNLSTGEITVTVPSTPATSNSSKQVATTEYVKNCVPKSVGDANTPVYVNSDGVVTTTGKSFANYVPTSRKVNNKALSADITLSASDVGALASNGNAVSATEFSAAKSVTLTGDVTGSASSKAGWSIATTLANSGATAGSYGPSADASPSAGGTFSVPYITVDAKGRVTAASTKTVTVPSSATDSTKLPLAGGTMTGAGDITLPTKAFRGRSTNVDLSNTSTSLREYWPFQIMRNTDDTTNSSGNLMRLGVSQSANKQDFSVILGVSNPRGGNLPTGSGVNTSNCWGGIGVYYDYATNKVYPVGTGLTSWAASDSNASRLASTEHVKSVVPKSVGSSTKPVYTNSNGVVTVCDYELNKTVPSDAVFTDTKVSVTELSTDSDSHSEKNVLIKSGSLNANGTEVAYWNRGLRIHERKGTTSRTGNLYLALGNAIATGTDNNMRGILRLFSTKANYADIMQADITSNVTHTFPATGGTILNTGTTALSNAASSGKKVADLKINGTTTTLYAPPPDNMGAASASAAGTAGLVPAPAAGKQGQYLRGDGTWATPTNTSPGSSGSATFATAKGTAPGSNSYHEHISYDNTGNGNGSAYRFALVGRRLTTGNESGAYLTVYNPVSGSTASSTLGIYYPSGGTPYTVAPTPAQTDDSTKIATTAYVKDCVPKTVGDANTPVYVNSNGVVTSTGKSFANYVPTSRKVNGKALTGDITLTASDVGADASGVGAVGVDNGSLAVGSYVLAITGVGGSSVNNGATCNGSNLRVLSLRRESGSSTVISGDRTSTSLSGTWRNVSGSTIYAQANGSTAGVQQIAGLFQRIS